MLFVFSPNQTKIRLKKSGKNAPSHIKGCETALGYPFTEHTRVHLPQKSPTVKVQKP